MRVLAIAQRLLLGESQGQILRFCLANLLGQIGGDVSVVCSGVAEDLGGQTAAGFQRRIAMSLEFFQHRGVVGIIDHDCYKSMVLGRTAQHGRTTDVDVLDGILKRRSLFLDGLLEGIEVHHHHVDGRNVIGFHLLHVFRVGAHREQTAVHLRMQGFHTTVHDFREARHIADADGFHTGSLQGLAGAARGDDFKT